MNRSILVRIIALFVLGLAGVYYIVFDAADEKIINKPYHVSVVLHDAGGIYTDAYVTYRGVEVGKVSGLDLLPNEVIATLAINHGVKIPANVTASVRELTAAAEQYMDLVPTDNDPPYLKPGAQIPMNRTSIPITVGTLLNTVNSLVNSLHASDLNTLSQALAQGLGGAGADLHSIIVDGNTLVDSLQSAIPGTQQLIDAGNNDLSTFNDTSEDFASFSANLNLLSQAVANSNSDVESLLQNGSKASSALNQFLSQYGSATTRLINSLSAVTNTTFVRQPAFKTLFEVLPLFSTDVASVATNGQIRFQVDFNTESTVCPYTSNMAEPTSLVALANLTNNCDTTAADLLQRGADKAPPPTPNS